MSELTISQIAQQAGIRPSTIRYYESINVLPEPRRVSGQRRYDETILERLAFIQVTQKLGFSLTEIQQLLQSHNEDAQLSEQWQNIAQQKLVQVELLLQRASNVKQLLSQGLQCGCSNLLDCIQCVLLNCNSAQR
ncbi:MerR family transcriptional regulator [Dictyobacter arantiisoli]|uniref:MerR family transcriptional regulator n=1 Tax=Dictyobacter arantiisoli TaxID=2014874 RepID=A0A5A5TL85_9CHLR|nr:MerR family transcriptional regulator [Dictyobacter arantiisoli]GCF11833.1 MerR family transcriptional regulator [Dictyobacter arantiisoli]